MESFEEQDLNFDTFQLIDILCYSLCFLCAKDSLLTQVCKVYLLCFLLEIL